MSEIVQPQEASVQQPEKKKKEFLIFNGKTRYYGFRNTRRLTALRWFNALFILLGVSGFLCFLFGVGTFVLWFMLFIVTLTAIRNYTDNWFNVIETSFLLGGALISASIVLRFLVDLIFRGLEKLELKANPVGAEKYLKVRKAAFKVELINLVLLAIVFGLGYLAYSSGFGKNAETIIFVIAAIAAFITSRVFLQKIYGKVREEIIEIRKERKENRENKY